MKTLDKITASALACGQVASKPRVNERNLTDIRYFCALQMKGCRVGKVIQHPYGETLAPFSLTVSNHPAPSKVSNSKTTRRTIMSIPAITNSREPADVVNPITAKISFITDLLSQQLIDNNAELHLSVRGTEGLYWFLREIGTDLESILPRLNDIPLEV